MRLGNHDLANLGYRSAATGVGLSVRRYKTFPTFLAQAYLYKEIGDYGVGYGANVTMDEANDAIAAAERFIDCVTTLLT
jgi:hypothetical protein